MKVKLSVELEVLVIQPRLTSRRSPPLEVLLG